MGLERSFARKLRQLQRSLSLTWITTWIIGLALLAGTSIRLAARARAQELDARLRTLAIAVYGLAWFDDGGRFHPEWLHGEEPLLRSSDDIWVIEPGPTPTVHWRPEQPKIEPAALTAMASKVVTSDAEQIASDRDAAGRPYRLLGLPTYFGRSSAPSAAILVIADTTPMRAADAAFTRRIVLITVALGACGVGVGLYLAHRSLRPVAKAMAHSEQFIAAATHELRNPLAAMRAVHDSAAAGDEPAEQALRRLRPLLERTTAAVEDLLLFTRLEAGGVELERRALRLDLLVESCLPEAPHAHLEAQPSTVTADGRLVTVALCNLLRNANQHGGAGGPIRVRVGDGVVVIEDSGPGFPQSILVLARNPLRQAPSAGGNGLGLATAQLIARLHGGALELENLPGGGARATFRLR